MLEKATRFNPRAIAAITCIYILYNLEVKDKSYTIQPLKHVTPAMQKEATAKMDELLTPIEYKDTIYIGNL